MRRSSSSTLNVSSRKTAGRNESSCHMTLRRSVVGSLAGVALSVLTIGLVNAGCRAAPSARTKNMSSPRTAWGAPDLQGLWSTATVTPMERPKEFEGKEFLTQEEAAAFAKRAVEKRDVD